MSYLFDFDPTNRIIRARFSGQVTDDDLLSFYRMAALLVESLDPLAGVTDFSGVTAFLATAQMIRTLASFPPVMPQQALPRVIVAPTDEIFGMARMFELEGEPTRPNLHVIRTVDQAWQILGIQNPQFKSIPDGLESRRAMAKS